MEQAGSRLTADALVHMVKAAAVVRLKGRHHLTMTLFMEAAASHRTCWTDDTLLHSHRLDIFQLMHVQHVLFYQLEGVIPLTDLLNMTVILRLPIYQAHMMALILSTMPLEKVKMVGPHLRE